MAALAKARRRSPRFARRVFSAQTAALQTHAHVRRGEADQRRRFVVGPERARLPLLVATVTDRDWLVGRSKSRMVQEIFGRVLSRRRNHRPVFHLGATAVAFACVRAPRFSTNHNSGDGQLLLFQLTDSRALFVAD